MLSHVCVGVADFARAYAFYAPLMERLGCPLRFAMPENHIAGWMPADAPRPLFFIGRPFDGNAASFGNGQMTAFMAKDRATVDACHAMATKAGGTCEGPPGLRPHYHPDYYGAYFRDLDGNKICVCCHTPA
jgi:catechol 2,3-dioxygenase-like lactoylglutathione lyase family enzyme